jgi:hypothetical protein
MGRVCLHVDLAGAGCGALTPSSSPLAWAAATSGTVRTIRKLNTKVNELSAMEARDTELSCTVPRLPTRPAVG